MSLETKRVCDCGRYYSVGKFKKCTCPYLECGMEMCRMCMKKHIFTVGPECPECKEKYDKNALMNMMTMTWYKKDYTNFLKSGIIPDLEDKVDPGEASCTLCTFGFTKSSHMSKTECPYCNIDICRSCVKKWLMSYDGPSHCPECKGEWSIANIEKMVTKNWTKEYLKHHSKYLLDVQIAMLPETQAAMNSHGMPIESVLKFSRKCPGRDCRGFMDQDLRCGICTTVLCKNCNEVLVDRHVCDPETVKTVKLLEKDTKPCPKCGEGIFKIDGCDQMWCITCHVAFSWKSGAIETKIHNTEYYRWMREHGQTIPGTAAHAPLPCGLIEYRHLMDLFVAGTPQEIIDIISNFHRILMEYTYVYQINDYRERYRMKYLTGRINIDEFKRLILTQHNSNASGIEIKNIKNTVLLIGISIFERFIQSPHSYIDALNEIEELRVFANLSLDETRRRYSISIYGYTKNWDLISLVWKNGKIPKEALRDN